MYEVAIDELKKAAAQAQVDINSVEITHESGVRTDLMMGTSYEISSWHLGMEIFGNNTHGARRHRFIKESSEKLEQCVARAVVAMVPPKQR